MFSSSRALIWYNFFIGCVGVLRNIFKDTGFFIKFHIKLKYIFSFTNYKNKPHYHVHLVKSFNLVNNFCFFDEEKKFIPKNKGM